MSAPRFVCIAASALALALLAAACNPFTSKDPGSPSASGAATKPAGGGLGAGDRIRVRTESPARDAIASFLETTSHVEAIREADVYPKTGGVVREIRAEEGDFVKENQVLAVLDQVEAKIQLKQSEIGLEESKRSVQEANLALEESQKKESQARSDADQAKRDFERDEKLSLSEDGTGLRIVAPKVVEASKLAWERAENGYQVAQFAVRKSHLAVAAAATNQTKAQWAVTLANVKLSDTEIKAPFAGVVSHRGIKLGETATQQSKIFKITDLENLQTVFFRPQRDLRLLEGGGQDVAVTSEAITVGPLSSEFKIFRGRVERIAPVVDPQSGSFKVTASLKNPEGLLRPGLLVRVRVTLGRRENAYLIPKRARVLDGEKPFVYVVRGGATVRVAIEEGYSDADRIEVRNVTPAGGGGKGLREDDQVIVVANVDLKEGMTVTLDNNTTSGG